jgi:hypothetical protein
MSQKFDILSAAIGATVATLVIVIVSRWYARRRLERFRTRARTLNPTFDPRALASTASRAAGVTGDYASQWSTENLAVPMSFLAEYIADEGKQQLEAAGMPQLVTQWEQLKDDHMGFWNFHIKHGGNFKHYLDRFVAPTLEKRQALLEQAGMTTSNLSKFISNILEDIKN